MKEIKPGMKIKIIADTFKLDPHEIPIGTECIVAGVFEVVKVDDMTQSEMLLVMETLGQVVDLPARVYVEGPHGYAIVPYTDLEVTDYTTALPEYFDPMLYFIGYDDDELLEGSTWDWDDEDEEEFNDEMKIEMLRDDYFEGYKAGDIFDAEYDEDHDAYIFTDHDGDIRELDEAGQHKYKILK